MSKNYNAYSMTSTTFGGGVPVWAELPGRYISGGFVKNTIAAGTVISAGTPLYFDVETKDAKFLKCYKIKAATVVDTNTTIAISVLPGLPVPVVGEYVMMAPSTIGGTGKAVAVTTLDSSVAGEVSFTVATASLDTITVGGFLCQSSATAAGSGKSLYCQPNSLSIEDTVIADHNTVGVARGPKYIFKNTIPPMPTVVSGNIPMLEFDSFNEMQNSGYLA